MRHFRTCGAVLTILLAGFSAAQAEDARITVVAILADNTTAVDPKLSQIATEVKKHESSLTGFKIHSTECKDVNVGQKESFPLTKDTSLDVTVVRKDDAKKRIEVVVKPPAMGEIRYSICYDKYMPIVTRTADASGRLVIAIMAEQPKAKDSAQK